MLNQKEKQLLDYLLEKRDSFTTSKELADYLFCSDRTVRTYLKQLDQFLATQDGASLISKQGYGYQLIVDDMTTFKNSIQDHEKTNPLSDSDDRYKYILNKLLFEQTPLYFDHLAQTLFISRSTLSNEFKKIRKDLNAYDLHVESKANKGVYITGSERNKRRFIMDYFFKNKGVSSYLDETLHGSVISLEEITFIVLEECREAQLKLSDYVIQNLAVHIALALKRMADGFQLAPIKELNVEQYPLAHQVGQRILQRIDAVTGIRCPKEEIDYITLHLISKKSLQSQVPQEYNALQMKKDLLTLLQTDDVLKPFKFETDTHLIDGVITHLMTLYIRLQTKIHLDNPLKEMILKKYYVTFDMTRYLLSQLPIFSTYDISDDEIAYVTLHFMASLERLKEKKKCKILVICATGFGSAQLLKHRIENEFGNTIIIEDVIGYYDLNDQKLQNVDFIISSIDLSNLIFNIPVCTVSVFLTSDDTKKIRRVLKQVQQHNEPMATDVLSSDYDSTDQTANQHHYFDHYFHDSCFFVTENETKDTLLEKMIQQLADGEDSTFETTMATHVRQREQMSSVVFCPTIAVPHPIKPVGKQHKIGVAIVKDGLQWDEQTPHVTLVFLPSPSIYGNDGLTQLTRMIVALVDDDDSQRQLVNCETFQDFKNIFLRIGGE